MEEVEHYDSLDEAALAADVVVRASADDVVLTRVIVGETESDRVPMIGVILKNHEVLAGDVPSNLAGNLTIEFIGNGGETPDKAEGSESIAYFKTALVGVDAVYFLRSKAAEAKKYGHAVNPAEADFYRLESSTTIAVEVDDKVVHPFGGSDDSAPLTAPYASLDELSRHIATLGR